jgi:hypothetical protein
MRLPMGLLLRTTFVTLCGFLPGLGVAVAQDASPPANEAVSPTPTACAPKAALYTRDKAPKLWVLRRGTMVLAENPLRPLSQDEAVVLEVVVNGKRAAAWGIDTDHLRQGASIRSVEAEGRGPVRWAEAEAMPAALRVIAEDGSVVLGPLPFGGCEDAPAAKAIAEKPAARPKTERASRRNADNPGGADRPLPGHLPQGALDGLSLPQPRR